MPPHQLLQLFADGLPNNVIFSNIRQYIYILLNETDDHHLLTMEHIYAHTRIIDDTSACLCLHHTNAKPCQSNPPQPSATTTELKTKLTCGNCGGVHLMKNCFQAGGAMEGKCDEVLASRLPRSSQVHIAVMDIGDMGTVLGADDDDYEVMDLMSINLAAMSITRPISAESITYSLYAMSTITKSSIPNSNVITPAYLVSLKITQNSVLNSACT